MLKEKTDSIVAVSAALLFLVLVVYLFSQDPTIIGPI